MIVFLTLCYAAVLAILVRIKLLPNNGIVWSTTLVWIVVLLLVLFIPMQWGAPAGPVRLLTQTVQIVPNVSGDVVEVPVQANEPLKAGDVLFEIDAEPFEANVALKQAALRSVEAQVEQDVEAEVFAKAALSSAEARRALAATELENDRKLVQRGTISEIQFETSERNLATADADVEQAKSELAIARSELGALMSDSTPAKLSAAKAELDLAIWELSQTTVKAPSDGFVTFVALGVGQRVTNLPLQPAMGFIDTNQTALIAEIDQIFLRHVKSGQIVELAFKTMPGQIVEGTVERIVDVNASGQATNAATLPQAGNAFAEPYYVRIKLKDQQSSELRAGTVGTAAIYTDQVKATHLVRKVMIRMEAIMNYVNVTL